MKNSLTIIIISIFILFSIKVKSQSWQWVSQGAALTTSANDAQAIVTSLTGEIYATGYFEGTLSFGSHVITSAGNSDMYLAKYDASGNCLWAIQGGGEEGERGYGVSTDGAGNCYVVGVFDDTASFGSIVLNNINNSNIFIAKYNSSGTCLWAKQAGSSYSGEEAYGIVTTNGGLSYVTGTFMGTSVFGSNTITSNGINGDIFIAKYDASGNCLWAKKAGGSGMDISYSIASDAARNIYIAGFFENTCNFGNPTPTLTAMGMRDAFVAKYDSSGNCLWAKQVSGGTSALNNSFDVGVDGSGNSYITGNFGGSTTFGTIVLNANSSQDDIFVAKYDASGLSSGQNKQEEWEQIGATEVLQIILGVLM